jgi:hypothetical protein
MKKTMKPIIIPIFALVIASCGGGNNNQTQGGSNATDTSTTNTNTASTQKAGDNDRVYLSDLPGPFATFVEKLPVSPAHSPRKDVAYRTSGEEKDGKQISYTFCAFPKKDGGYIELCAITESQDGCLKSKSYDTYIDTEEYMKRIQNVLPVPPLNTNKKAGHEADFNAFEAIYKTRPDDFIYYFIKSDGEIRAVLQPPSSDIPGWNDKCYDFINQNYNPPTYRWDGEKFVQVDKFAEFLNGLSKSPDKPVYHFSDGYSIQEQFCDADINFYAFPKKDGGYMSIVSYNEQCEASMWWNDSTYNFQNGKIQGAGGILPVPEMITLLDPEKCKGKDAQVQNIIKQYNGNPRGYLLYRIQDDGTMSVSAEGAGCENWGEIDLELMVNATYKWDGEKFVRTDSNAAAPADNAVAKEVFKKQFPKTKNIEWYEETPLKCFGYPESESEGCGASEAVACYPLKDGGYMVTFTSEFSGPGCASEYRFWTEKYKDGKLTGVDGVLPVPNLEDLLNPDKAADYKSDVAKFKSELFDENPHSFICYEFQPPKTLTVRLHPWDCENAYYNMDKVMLDPYNDDKVPVYIWDDEKFVKQQ